MKHETEQATFNMKQNKQHSNMTISRTRLKRLTNLEQLIYELLLEAFFILR